MELQKLSWLALVGLFLASLLIVLVWLFQFSLSLLQQWRTRKAAEHQQRQHGLAAGAWGFLLKLRDAGAESEVGAKALLASLFSFKSFSEQCRRSWVKALNEQACRNGVSANYFSSSREEVHKDAGSAERSRSGVNFDALSRVLEVDVGESHG